MTYVSLEGATVVRGHVNQSCLMVKGVRKMRIVLQGGVLAPSLSLVSHWLERAKAALMMTIVSQVVAAGHLHVGSHVPGIHTVAQGVVLGI